MASLQGNTIKDTYKSLLKVADNGELEAGLQEITDGDGNGTGVSLNTGGDVTATGTVAFGSLKDSGENITVTKFVDEADGIAANDNDTSIPTSAAVKDYVDSNVTAQDLDITDGTNVGAVDLDSQSLTFTGAGTVSTNVSGQTVTITGSGTDLSNTPSANNVVVESSDGNNTTLGAATTSVAGVMTSADKSKLDGIETGAEVNPDASEVKTLYESNADTNAFTDAEQTKLGTIESGAEVNPDAAEVKSLYESNANTNAFTDAEQTKLANIEAGAQVNTVDSVNTQTGAVVLDADDIDDSTTTNKFTTQTDIDKLAGIESGAEVNTVDSVNGETGVVVLDADDISDTSTTNKFVTSTEITKLGNITVTQAVNLDTLESDVATNNAKISFDSTSSSKLAGIEENADVTDATNVAAAGAMMTGVAVLNDLSDVSGTPSDGQVLTYDTVNGWQPETAASAPVTSVNSETGAVVLDADDISDATTTNKFTTQTDIDKLAGIESGAEVNTVDSVNTQTGAVVLDADDIDDSTTTNKFTTQTDIDKLAGIESGAEVNTVDSVNSQTGVVVLDADDIDDTTTTHKFTTQTDIDKLAGIESGADVTDATNVAAAGALMSGTAALSDLVDVSSATPADGQVLTYDTVNGWQPEDSQGGEEYTISEISTNTTAQVNFLYVLTANLTLTLPATPSVGDRVALSNMSGTTTPTVARNGNLIAGLAEDLTIDVLNLSVEFIYSGASQGWIIFVDSILGTSGGGGSVDGNGTTNFISKWSDANTLTDSVIFDDGTNVGIGTSSPAVKLDVDGAGKFSGNIESTSLTASIVAGRTTGIGYFGNITGGAYLQVYGDSHATKANEADISAAGGINILNNVKFPNGNGIDFSASAGGGATSSLLDDYEEGTWTVGIAFGGSSTGALYYSNTGTYTKIGRQVTVIGYLDLQSKGSSTGSTTITGLPFTVGAASSEWYSACSMRTNKVAFGDGIGAITTIGSTVIGLEELVSSTVSSRVLLSNNSVSDTASFIFSLTYFTS